MSPVIDLTPPPGLNWDLLSPGVSGIRLIARLPAPGSEPKINSAAEVTGAWQVTYNPVAADVDTIGTYDVEIEALSPTGKKLTLPTKGYLKWTIESDLDDA